MTKKQVERAAQFLHEIAAALFLGAGADLVLVTSRRGWDVIGLAGSLLMFMFSLRLTGRLGGPKI